MMHTQKVLTGPASADRSWRAIVTRDRQADGRFVYAVRSTGIFCRPSCPSRKPNRELVEFFDTPADAERAGFRACRRCHPSAAPSTDPWIEKIRRACVYLSNVEGHPSLANLANRLGGSPYHLQRNFKRIVGVTPREYAEACRLRAVKGKLKAGGDVTNAMLDAGYGSAGRFYERAAPRLGMNPRTYQRGGAGMSIRYTIVGSPLGRLLVAATPRGVCAIAMGDSDRDLTEGLQRCHPAASIEKDRRGLSRWTRAVLARLKGKQPRVDLPVDVQATAFQWQVWNALAAIPSGTTRSYSDVAAAIGRPGAARAVARACATNPVAIVIPCHRVVPGQGGTGGYRWGAERKKALLRKEQSANG